MGKVFRNSLFGLVGILVVWQLYFVIASFLGKLLLHTGLATRSLFKVGFVLSIIVIIIGFIIGVRAADKKKIFYKIFQPNSQNMFAAIILSVLLVTYAFFAKGSLNSFFILKIAISAVLFYPFTALALYAYNNWDKKPIKQSKTLVILILIVLSPIALVVGSGMNSKFSHPAKFGHGKYYSGNFVHSKYFKISEGCGAYAYGFPENSPAKSAGMQVGETIKEINGQEIKTLQDIKDITYPLTEETEIIIVTDKGTYEVTTYYDEVKGKQRFGVNVRQACGKFRHKFK